MSRRAPAAAPVPIADTISPRTFRQIAELIQARTGIKMPAAKIHLIEGRLMRRAREAGADSIDAYCHDVLMARDDDPILTDFFNAVTTNKTDFFREPAHFDVLADRVVPAWRAAGRRVLRCWSAAASTGMEAYTLAIVLDQALVAGEDFAILATDLDTRVLAEARRGVYRREDIAPVPADMRDTYFARARDPARPEVRVVADLRRKVAFARMNLMDGHYPIGDPMDVIFCRNVLIYFEKETQLQVISRLCAALRPGGHLFLGHSESVHNFDLPLEPVAHTVFRKKG